jgi:thymidylate synthase (FAD)
MTDMADIDMLRVAEHAFYADVLPVVDHDAPGSVRLVDWMGSDLDVVRAARVSYAAEARAGDDEKSDTKLINYLMRNGHTTPFEMVQFRFEIKLPIFVCRQWHRHRTWSYNEVSARYTELDEGFYVPAVGTYGTQSKSSKQARDFADEVDAARANPLEAGWRNNQIAFNRAAVQVYRKFVEESMPRELARSVLPVAMYTRMQASVDLHNLLHFIRLRSHAHAQYEIRVYSDAMLRMIETVVPVSVAAFREHVLKEKTP